MGILSEHYIQRARTGQDAGELYRKARKARRRGGVPTQEERDLAMALVTGNPKGWYFTAFGLLKTLNG